MASSTRLRSPSWPADSGTTVPGSSSGCSRGNSGRVVGISSDFTVAMITDHPLCRKERGLGRDEVAPAPSTPGHKCPGSASTKKPAEAGSKRRPQRLSLLQEAFRLKRSPGVYARASKAPCLSMDARRRRGVRRRRQVVEREELAQGVEQLTEVARLQQGLLLGRGERRGLGHEEDDLPRGERLQDAGGTELLPAERQDAVLEQLELQVLRLLLAAAEIGGELAVVHPPHGEPVRRRQLLAQA